MAKLYPPKIDGILPAFAATSFLEVPLTTTTYKKNQYYYINDSQYILDDSNSITAGRKYFKEAVKITIPYQLNFSSTDVYDEISYVIKSATTNTEIKSGSVEPGSFNQEKKQYEINLILDKNDFNLGQYYKIQIAFSKENELGYYSNVGVAKYVNVPTIEIEHHNLRKITASFSDLLTHENVYSYEFQLCDEFDNIIETSGEKIHNNREDVDITKSQDHWEIQTTLQSEIKYKIKYKVITTGNYLTEAVLPELNYFETIAPQLGEAILLVENNFEEGYNKIYLEQFFTRGAKPICGNFMLLKASSIDNFEKWEYITDFQIYNWEYDVEPILNLYKDYLIEQGVFYRYAIQAYNDKGIYSTKMYNDNGPIYSDFEDMFLYDGYRQLKIRFNPKVSSFKPVLLENKLDTIGHRFPYFFRNGNTNYKEFAISGLISMLQDEHNEFISYNVETDDEIIYYQFKTELTAENYKKERDFKLEVLNWLTNGKEKVLKTPSEGNYIIRLLNTSLSPTDTFGRMLHTFQATAYEAAEYSLINLKTFNFINGSQVLVKRVAAQMKLSGATANILPKQNEVKIDQAVVYTLPNTEFTYVLNDNTSDTVISNGYGVADLTTLISSVGLKSIINNSKWNENSYITYSYLNQVQDTDSWYYIKRIVNQTPYENTIAGKGVQVSMKEQLNNETQIISSFPYLKISRRDCETIYQNGGNYYTDAGFRNLVNFQASKIYQISGTGYYLDGADISKAFTKSSGVFFIQFEESREDLDALLTEDMPDIIFRDNQDFCLGQGLIAHIICPKKTLELTSVTNGNYSYAI